MWEFLGCLSGEALSLLPNTITFLNLTITSDNHAACLMPQLTITVPRLPLLAGLCFHIRCGVSATFLTQVPASCMLLWLLLTDIDDSSLTRACDIASKLLPIDSMYMDIRFPRARVTAAGWGQLLQGFKKRGVIVGHITIPEDAVFHEEEYQLLRDTAHAELRSDFRKYSNDRMWEPMLHSM